MACGNVDMVGSLIRCTAGKVSGLAADEALLSSRQVHVATLYLGHIVPVPLLHSTVGVCNCHARATGVKHRAMPVRWFAALRCLMLMPCRNGRNCKKSALGLNCRPNFAEQSRRDIATQSYGIIDLNQRWEALTMQPLPLPGTLTELWPTHGMTQD